MEKNIYRINDYSLLRIFDTTLSTNYTIHEFPNDVKQYVDNGISNSHAQKNLNQQVWFDGEFKHRLNKTYGSLPLIDTISNDELSTVQQVDVMLRQGFNFYNVFGLLINILDVNNNKVYVSQILFESDFKITSDKELIDGSFWMLSSKLFIPKTNKTLSVEITTVTFDDINSETGLLYYYPVDFIPLVSEKPIPDYILTQLTLDENFYLETRLYTTENKTIEQSILDYFEVSIADISVSHVINYGNDLIGYKNIRLSNEDNKYLPIKIGLDLTPWKDVDDTNINIHVITEIDVNGKLMQREAILHTNILDVINPLIANKIIHPISNYPVEIKQENIVNQQVIQTNKDVRVVTIYQPIYVQMLSDDIILENKNITFQKLVTPSYLVINKTDKVDEQIIESKITIDNQIYFDISNVVPVDKDTKYQIYAKEDGKFIGSGRVLLKKPE